MRRTLILVLCLLVSQADAQLPFFGIAATPAKWEPPPVRPPTTDPQLLRTRRGQDYDLPAPEPIVSAIKGSDPLDTAARKVAAASILHDLTRFLSGTTATDGMPDKLSIRNQDYFKVLIAERKIERDLKCAPDDCPRRRYFDATWGYEFDPVFLAEVLATVRPDIRSRYMAYKASISNPAPAAPPAASEATDPSDTTETVPDWILWLIGLFAFLALLGRLRRGPGLPPVSTNYGSARFADPPTDLPNPQAFQKGIFLGKGAIHDPRSGPEARFAPVYTTPERHTLIVAPTRAGKGARVIIPTLLRYQGSILTIDPKGENAAITANTRLHDLGQKVYILNPWNMLQPEFAARGFPATATLNPLDLLAHPGPDTYAFAESVALAICAPIPNDPNPYWQNDARSLLRAVLLWLADQPQEEKTLERVREIVTLPPADLASKFLVPMSLSSAFGGAISNYVSNFLGMAPNTYSGVISTLKVATDFISDPQLKAATKTSTFPISDLATSKTTLYLVIPPERMATQKTWLRLLIATAMHAFKTTPKRPEGHRCLFLIDEFPALGRIDDLPTQIATVAGHGIDMALIVQGLEQLKAHYGDADAATISNNCAWKWFCNINDNQTAKYVSEGLGQKTIRIKTEGEQTGTTTPARGGGSERVGKSISWSETGRDLLTPDEVQTLGRAGAVVFQPDTYRLFVQPIDHWDLPSAFAYLKQTHPALYWDPPLNPDPNPYIQTQSPAPKQTQPSLKTRLLRLWKRATKALFGK